MNLKCLKNHKGQGMVEYILIIAVVVGIIFVAWQLLGGKVKEQFTKSSAVVATADQE